MATLVETILNTSKSINNGRNRDTVLKSCMMELGELAQEVAVVNGESYKTAGPDGVVGESLDLIASAVDQIYIERPDITEAEMVAMIIPKLNKWKAKTQEAMNNVK